MRHVKNKMAERDSIESSGNDFADQGFPETDDMLAKADVAIHSSQAPADIGSGGERPTSFYTLIGTAKPCGLNPSRYLRIVLVSCP